MDKVETILENASMECESANYHDRCSMAENLFDAIKDLVPKNNHIKVAKAIAEAVTRF